MPWLLVSEAMIIDLPLAASYSPIATGVDCKVSPSGVTSVTAATVLRSALRVTWLGNLAATKEEPSGEGTKLGYAPEPLLRGFFKIIHSGRDLDDLLAGWALPGSGIAIHTDDAHGWDPSGSRLSSGWQRRPTGEEETESDPTEKHFRIHVYSYLCFPMELFVEARAGSTLHQCLPRVGKYASRPFKLYTFSKDHALLLLAKANCILRLAK
jgi:hypothetical protein